MFENSYFSTAQLQCLHHGSKISHICTDYKCAQNPFFCSECLNSYSYNLKHSSHESQIKQFQQAISMMSGQILRTKKPIESMHRSLLANKESQSLLKWQEEKEQHFVSIHNHIKSIKHLVDEEIDNICRKFRESLLEEKAELDRQLERYEESYRQKLLDFARLTQPIAAMSTTYKYCANKNNIVLKLVSETSQKETIRWFNNLKRTIRLSQKVEKDLQGYHQEVKRLSKAANQLMDDLPRIRDTDYEREALKMYSSLGKEVLRIFVKVRESPNLSRSHSMNGAFNDSGWKPCR